MGAKLLQMTVVMGRLHALAERAAARGVPATVLSRFSEDVANELPIYVAAAEPDIVVFYPDGVADEAFRADDTTRLITVRADIPHQPSAVAVYLGHGPHAAAALDVATQLAAARQLELVLAGPDSRRARTDVAGLNRQSITVGSGPPREGCLLVASEDDAAAPAGAHLRVRASSNEELDVT